MGYLETVQRIYEVFIGRKNEKKHGVWMVGPPNIGKSKFSDMIKEIFVWDELNIGRGGFVIGTRVLDCEPQVVVIDEAPLSQLFKEENIHNTKRLMEGKGYFCDEKMIQGNVKYVGSYTFITSNYITIKEMR
jgi:hypothetical protein